MIDRAQKMLNLGQMQYDMSHQISESARPFIDYRFEACDDFNAVHDRIAAMQASEVANKTSQSEKKKVKSNEAENVPTNTPGTDAKPENERIPSKGDRKTDGNANQSN